MQVLLNSVLRVLSNAFGPLRVPDILSYLPALDKYLTLLLNVNFRLLLSKSSDFHGTLIEHVLNCNNGTRFDITAIIPGRLKMRRTRFFRGIIPLIMILNAVFSTGSPQADFILKGAGATFPRPLYEEWIKLYEKQTGIRIGYRGIGVHRDGSFAEYVSVPAANVIPLNPKISDDVASIFDPFGNAAHTALSFPLVGEDVLITGAGLIGCIAVAICRFAGARHIVVTDLSDYRLALAQKLGRCRAVNPGREKLDDVVKELGITGFDVGLEMSGSPQAFKDMIAHMYNGGKIALLGILPEETHVPWDKIIFKALYLKGIYGREMFETWYKMEAMLLSGLDIAPMITHRFPVAGFQEGFDVMEEGKCGKVVLSWE